MIYKYIPNIITILRLLLIAPFLYALQNERYVPAFFIFGVAGMSDGVDGFLARRYGWTTWLGSFLDPLADKLLVMTSFFSLTYLGKVPYWLCILVIFRDLMIMTGVGGMFAMLNRVEFKPSLISKMNTVLQVMLIASLLFEMAFALLPTRFIDALMYMTVITTVTSLVHYVGVNSLQVYRSRQG